MKKLLLGLSIIAGLTASYSFKNAECAWCPSYKCFSRCSTQCSCVTFGGNSGGSCVSVERAGSYIQGGALELK